MEHRTCLQLSKVKEALDMLQENGIDAVLSKFWLSNGEQYVIVLRNIEVSEERDTDAKGDAV